MYGLINNSMKEMICKQFGEDKWQEVMKVSGVPENSFLTMRSYDDRITYDLVGAAAEVLGMPVEACLETFGRYWVLETATNSYGMLLDAAGSDMMGFLRNLNALHDRITSTFLNYIPPEFQIEEGPDHYLIHYISQRKGLTAFVTGLLQGLATRFSSELTIVEQIEIPTEHGTHAVFKVQLGTA